MAANFIIDSRLQLYCSLIIFWKCVLIASIDPSIISVLIGGDSIDVVVVGRVLGTIGFQNYSNRSLPLEATTPEHSPHHPYSHKDAAYYCTI